MTDASASKAPPGLITFTPAWKDFYGWEGGALAVLATTALGVIFLPSGLSGSYAWSPYLKALLIFCAAGLVLIAFKQALWKVRTPAIVAAVYILMLFTAQGADAIRSLNQSPGWEWAGWYVFWAYTTGNLTYALVSLLVLRLDLVDPTKLVLNPANKLLLLAVTVAPVTGSIFAIYKAVTEVTSVQGSAASVALYAVVFAITLALKSYFRVSTLFGLTRQIKKGAKQLLHGFRKAASNSYDWPEGQRYLDCFILGVARNPDETVIAVGLEFLLLLTVIVVSNYFALNYDVVPMVFAAGWFGLLATLFRLVEWASLPDKTLASEASAAITRAAPEGKSRAKRVLHSAMLRSAQLQDLWPKRVAFVAFVGLVLILLAAGWATDHLGLSGNIAYLAAVYVSIGAGLVVVNRHAKTTIPSLALVFTLGVVWSALDLNDTYEIPFYATPTKPEAADTAFKNWLLENDQFKKGEEPTVFLLAAEGGGARAAYMTAVVLETLRTTCEAFARADFANIGVSGGSVGLAISAAAAKAMPSVSLAHASKSDDAKQAKAEGTNPAAGKPGSDCSYPDDFDPSSLLGVRVAGTDLLRPVIRGLLVGDIPMWLAPSSWLQTGGVPPETVGGLKRQWTGYWGDRAQYIERAIDSAGAGLEPLRWSPQLPFASAGPSKPGSAPALILLATDVTSGRRVAVSHLSFPETPAFVDASAGECTNRPDREANAQERSRLLTLAEIAPKRDPTLVGAALISARFPIVTPVATLPCKGTRWRLADGGYFENSGLTTALDLVTEMTKGAATAIASSQAGSRAHRVRVVLIALENGGADAAPGASMGMSEIMSPLRAYGGTRSAHADLARARVETFNPGNSASCGNDGSICVDFQEIKFVLNRCGVDIPLGWSLSEGARKNIRGQLGFEPADKKCEEVAAKNKKSFTTILNLATQSGTAPSSAASASSVSGSRPAEQPPPSAPPAKPPPQEVDAIPDAVATPHLEMAPRVQVDQPPDRHRSSQRTHPRRGGFVTTSPGWPRNCATFQSTCRRLKLPQHQQPHLRAHVGQHRFFAAHLLRRTSMPLT